MPLYPCGGLAEVEEMAEGEALGAVFDEGEDEWDLREGCSVQSGACVLGFETLPPCVSSPSFPLGSCLSVCLAPPACESL